MSLPGQVENAAPSVPGFDCDVTVSADLAQRFYEYGYKFCLRYVSRGVESPNDLSESEATGILNAGLALMPVQHVRKAGWSPNQALGQQDGQAAVANAQSIGFPEGVNVWCDLEGVGSSAGTQDVIDYCSAWYDAVSAAGYVPGLYVGANPSLTGDQLDALPFQHYWRSPSNVPDVTNRSYQLFQLFPSVDVNGIAIDLDVTNNDKENGAALWLRASTGAYNRSARKAGVSTPGSKQGSETKMKSQALHCIGVQVPEGRYEASSGLILLTHTCTRTRVLANYSTVTSTRNLLKHRTD